VSLSLSTEPNASTPKPKGDSTGLAGGASRWLPQIRMQKEMPPACPTGQAGGIPFCIAALAVGGALAFPASWAHGFQNLFSDAAPQILGATETPSPIKKPAVTHAYALIVSEGQAGIPFRYHFLGPQRL
jgi:hypothetical protein